MEGKIQQSEICYLCSSRQNVDKKGNQLEITFLMGFAFSQNTGRKNHAETKW